jgi:hypothetical protein
MSRAILIGVAIWATGLGSAAAQGVGSSLDVETIAMRQEGEVRFWWVKFICGTIEAASDSPQDPASPTDPLTPGAYRTAINITTSTSLGGLKLLAVEAKPLGDPAGRSGEIDFGLLLAGTAVEVDCKQIIDIVYPPGGRDVPPAPPFVKGFVRLFHPGGDLGPGFEGSRARSVHVVAVYTSNRVAGQ